MREQELEGHTINEVNPQVQVKRHFWQIRGRYKDLMAKWHTKPYKTSREHKGAAPGPTYQLSRGRRAWGGAIWGRPTHWVARPPTGPKQAHLWPAYSHRTAYASPWWFHLGSWLKDPPLEGYIRRRRAPHSIHKKKSKAPLQGEALPP